MNLPAGSIPEIPHSEQLAREVSALRPLAHETARSTDSLDPAGLGLIWMDHPVEAAWTPPDATAIVSTAGVPAANPVHALRSSRPLSAAHGATRKTRAYT